MNRIKSKENWTIGNKEVNSDGWIIFGYSLKGWDDINEWLLKNELNNDKYHYDIINDKSFYKIRPKSLQGIENNNGWIKIESENDLPKEDNWFYVFRLDNSIVLSKFRKEFNRWEVYEGLPTKGITHYQTIIKPKPPIY